MKYDAVPFSHVMSNKMRLWLFSLTIHFNLAQVEIETFQMFTVVINKVNEQIKQ